jgi:hypothetical protein
LPSFLVHSLILLQMSWISSTQGFSHTRCPSLVRCLVAYRSGFDRRFWPSSHPRYCLTPSLSRFSLCAPCCVLFSTVMSVSREAECISVLLHHPPLAQPQPKTQLRVFLPSDGFAGTSRSCTIKCRAGRVWRWRTGGDCARAWLQLFNPKINK